MQFHGSPLLTLIPSGLRETAELNSIGGGSHDISI